MKIEKAIKRRDQAQRYLRDLYSRARMFGLDSKTMESNRHDVLHSACAKAPQWVRQYLDGYWRALIERAYEQDLCFGGFYAGKFYSTHSKRADYYEKNGIEPSAFADDGAVTARGHYWINSVDAGTPKPFYLSKRE
jgi:hypothetical protein